MTRPSRATPRARHRFVAVCAAALTALVFGTSNASAADVVPQVTGTASNGWYTSAVEVSFALGESDQVGYSEILESYSCQADDGSDPVGVTFTIPFGSITTAPITLSSDTTAVTVACSVQSRYSDTPCLPGESGCENKFKNYRTITSNGATEVLKIDRSGPTDVAVAKDPEPNAAGWNNTDFAMTVTGTDTVSGPPFCSWGFVYGAGPVWHDPVLAISEETTSSSGASGCRNLAGLTTTAAMTEWKLDKTKPTLDPQIEPSPELSVDEVASASHGASDGLSGSGIKSASCDPVDTSTTGTRSVECTATDHADNSDTASVSYTVTAPPPQLQFTGFASPVENDERNIARAGRAVPLKFHVEDSDGPVDDLTIDDVTVSSSSVPCEGGQPTDTLEAYASGDSGLQNLGGGDYQWNWRTDKNWTGCRVLSLALALDEPHTADFQFKK